MRPITGLKPHPLSVRVYGLPTANDELLASVEKLGVLSAIVVDENDFVISGTSRHYASSVLHEKYPTGTFDKIPAVLFNGTALEAELLVIESNRQRVKKPSQLGREFNERFRIEQEFAKQRQEAGVPLKSAEGGDAREKAAKATGLGRSKAEQLGKIVTKADTNPKARRILQDLDEGKTSVSAAFAELQASPRAGQTPADCPICQKPFPSLTQLYKHGRHDHGKEVSEIKEMLGTTDRTTRRDAPGSLFSINSIVGTLHSKIVLDKYYVGSFETLLKKIAASQLTEKESEEIRRFIVRMGEVSQAHSEFKRRLEVAVMPVRPESSHEQVVKKNWPNGFGICRASFKNGNPCLASVGPGGGYCGKHSQSTTAAVRP